MSSSDINDDIDRARYRAASLADSLGASGPVGITTCATKRCHAQPTVAIRTIGYDTRAYCDACAKTRLRNDPAAREYPLSAVELPADDDATSIKQVNLTAENDVYELSHDDPGDPEAWIRAENTPTDESCCTLMEEC